MGHCFHRRHCSVTRLMEVPMAPDLIPLAQAHCIPRKGSEHRLGQARLAELLPQLPGWELAENGLALVRTFRFDNYYGTMAFVNALAWIAHAEDHHPDL